MTYLEQMYTRLMNRFDSYCFTMLQWTNTTSVISK